MSNSWLMFPGSERLHAVYKGDWHDSIVTKAMKLATTPVPFLSEFEEAGYNVSFVDALTNTTLQELSFANPAELPPEIADLVFGHTQRS